MNNADRPATPIITGKDVTEAETKDQQRLFNDLTGMTKREAFTLAAMQGLCAKSAIDDWMPTDYGEEAVLRADAPLTALEQ